MCGFVVIEGEFDAQFESKTIGSFKNLYNKLTHRGPDDHKLEHYPKGVIGFHRLAIMDLSPQGAQPFKSSSGNMVVCNGEVYNYLQLKAQCLGHQFISNSDCEVLLPLYETFGIQGLVEKLDAEFALVIWDNALGKIVAARDPMGIRPLFYGKTKEDTIAFASEVKALHEFCTEITPFPPGHYYDGEKIISYLDLSTVKEFHKDSLAEVLKGINTRLRAGVEKRLQSDAEVGDLIQV